MTAPDDLRERLERAAQELAITAPLGSERFMDAVDTAVEFIREAAARLGERGWRAVTFPTEQYFNGIRFDAGCYEIRRVPDDAKQELPF